MSTFYIKLNYQQPVGENSKKFNVLSALSNLFYISHNKLVLI